MFKWFWTIYILVGCPWNFCGLNVQRYKSHSFRIGAPVSQQTKVFLTPRFALLADGSLMPLNLLFVILHYKEFNFAWVRHGLPCILFVICRTFRSTQGLVYLVGGHARATPQCRVCMRWWSERGCIISYKDSAVRFFIAESVSLYSKKKKGVMVRRGLHHFLTQYKGFMF